MPDLAEIIQTGVQNPWLYMPAALVLGALHALEPGHSKSMMAAFIIAVRGTPAQAVVLGVAAAVGHTLVICLLAMAGLWLGDRFVLDKAEPWLVLITGFLILLIAGRIFLAMRSDAPEEEESPDHIEKRLAGRSVTTFDIGWFGLTAGLLPCPAAFAVLLVCLQLKEFTLGISMVAAFSVGLAVSLVSVGVVAAWSRRVASARISNFDRWARWMPYASVGILVAVGLAICGRGLTALTSA